MILIKTFAFPLACIAANLVLIAGYCVDIPAQSNFSFENFAGIWHARYLSKALLQTFNHLSVEMQFANDEVIVNGFVTNLESVNRQNTSVLCIFRIPEDNSSTVEFQCNPPFSALNRNYTLISDYNCYLIAYGCARELNLVSASLSFRVENPSEECEETALAAFERSGLNFTNLMGADPMYHQTNGSEQNLNNSL